MENTLFWKNVKDLLRENKMTVKDLANKSGLIEQSISNAIYRGNLPKIDGAYKIANILNVTMEYLLTGEEKTQNITVEEMFLINEYKRLSEKDKSLLKSIINLMIVANGNN